MSTNCRPYLKKSKRLLLALVLLAGVTRLEAAPTQPYNNRYYEDQNTAALREIRNLVENLRHAINNQETEIKAFNEKLSSMDAMIDALQNQVDETARLQKEQLKGGMQGFESKISVLESTTKGVSMDLKQLKTHANDTTSSLTQIIQRLNELEKTVERQGHDIDNLQAAMHSIVEAMGGGKSGKPAEAAAISSGNSYRVKPGDSLEKIAQTHQTTVKALKELNNIPEGKDKIVVGKILLLPEKKK